MTMAQALATPWCLEIPETYALSRSKFLAAASRGGLPVKSYVNTLASGIDGEELACDVVVLGPDDAEKVLLVSSGVHGIEGYFGSAMQCALLDDEAFLRISDDLRIVLVHALNPYGFSHFRRVNEDNVDLNRNFRDFSTVCPEDSEYGRVHSLVFPDDWHGADLSRILASVQEAQSSLGERELQNILTRGQYAFAEDPFFGGHRETWSRRTWSAICTEMVTPAKMVCQVDIHSGLGEAGACEIIFASGAVREKIDVARSWFGANRVKVPGDSESSSSNVSGFLGSHMSRYCENEVSIAMEFGTVPLWEMIEAVIADNWLAANAPVDAARTEAIHEGMKRAFFSQDPEWLNDVGREARDILLLAIEGLARESPVASR